jgi:hypothetical protein
MVGFLIVRRFAFIAAIKTEHNHLVRWWRAWMGVATGAVGLYCQAASTLFKKRVGPARGLVALKESYRLRKNQNLN